MLVKNECNFTFLFTFMMSVVKKFALLLLPSKQLAPFRLTIIIIPPDMRRRGHMGHMGVPTLSSLAALVAHVLFGVVVVDSAPTSHARYSAPHLHDGNMLVRQIARRDAGDYKPHTDAVNGIVLASTPPAGFTRHARRLQAGVTTDLRAKIRERTERMRARGIDRRRAVVTEARLRGSGYGKVSRGSHGGVSGEMNTELQRRFEDVYTLNLWDDGVSRSGHGSNPRSEEVLRDKPFIVDVINKKFKGRRNTLTIVDAPCGDMAWMPETLRAISESFTHVYYTGFDIVPQIIRANQRQSFTQRAGTRVTLKFEVRDISSMRLPTADVVICRDVINHLPRRSIRAVLDNLRQANIDYIILSNNFAPRGRPQVAEWARGFGANPQGGASRPIDVTKPPFNWPQPVERSQHLSLWENQIKESGDDQSQGGGGGFEFTAE